ncbi:cell division protein FtsZ [Formosa agariphila KMM 3901]|uniref:Cell division protein FtsZ n=1 Tax=Formosa agariphila (strain DSM 15362 / KCTC 12365 / LMG 23005 / KMM 3901 / M-2Alg 35-1) TaxID=1347342 RepID=T2KQ79_FORAG|nr:cell division protein FtsZ [Formosa agariphila]CDF80658.1 cell division protein FtsZ [Formosa agariphila KMM 3901]
MSSNKEFASISFDLPKNQSNVIKVIGVGGGGSNAINHMFQQGIKGVDFVICNTDAQALQNSGVPNKIQLGLDLTEGLGAGANPEIGEQSAVESYDDLKRMLDTNTKMIFITAGMGGGTGTGAAPIIAKMAKDLDVLTVGIVTMPFQFEGKMRNEQAQKGIEKLRNVVDSLIVINNNKLREVYGNLGFKAGFSKADEVLATAARGIAEVITHHYTQNIDLRDAKTVLSNSGSAIMGSSISSGQNRAKDAIMKALDSPLLNDNKIQGAKNVLLLIVSGEQEITIDEIGEINDHIQSEAGHGANIIMGVGEDDSLEESIAVTIIATGFNLDQQDEISNTEAKKVIHSLNEEQNLDKEEASKISREPAIIPPSVDLKAEVKAPEVIKHTLDINDLQDFDAPVKKETPKPSNTADLVETTQAVKDIEVTFENLSDFDVDVNDFVFTEVKNGVAETEIPEEDEKQITLTFDMPLQQSKPTLESQEEVEEKPVIKHSLEDTDKVKNTAVNEYVELINVTESNEKGEVRYVLDDYEEQEEERKAVVKQEKKPIHDDTLSNFNQDVSFVKKEATPEPTRVTQPEPVEPIDPMNTPISEMLKERAEERRRKMKDFNYKFNTSKIDEIEKIPAYKRQGVNLDETQHSSENNMSGTSLSVDDNNDIQLRSNNSFLHDNVD